MQLGSSCAFISCKVVPYPLFALHGNGSASGKGNVKEKGIIFTNPTHSYTDTHQNQNQHQNQKKKESKLKKLSCDWRRGSTSITPACCIHNAAESAVVTAMPSSPSIQEASLLLLKRGNEEEQLNINIIDTVHNNSELVTLEEEIHEKERKRRKKISQANRGKMPWNKGRKHSPETIARIKERTKLALQNPKIRQKLSLVRRSESKKTKESIHATFRRGWEGRRQRLFLQEACLNDWKESIAEAARRGGDDEDELRWDSYEVLKKIMQQKWLQDVAMKVAMEKKLQQISACKSAEHKLKISEAIKAKWADPDYRQNVLTGMHKVLAENCFRTPVRTEKKHNVTASNAIKRDKPPKAISQRLKTHPVARMCRKEPTSPRKRFPPSYSDPLAGEKLQMIRKLRANRTAMELKRREATVRARLLIAEAEKAAKTLEAAAVIDASAQAFLSETRRLLDEAIHSVQNAESSRITNAPMQGRISEIPTYTEMLQTDNFVDSYEVAGPSLLTSGGMSSVHQKSLTASRPFYGNIALSAPEEILSNNKLSDRNLCDHANADSHPISTHNIGSAEEPMSIDSAEGTVLEGTSQEVTGGDAMCQVVNNCVATNIACMADKLEHTDWKVEPLPAENIRREIVSSGEVNSLESFYANNEYMGHGIALKSEATPIQTGKGDVTTTDQKRKKWVCGRLIEVEED